MKTKVYHTKTCLIQLKHTQNETVEISQINNLNNLEEEEETKSKASNKEQSGNKLENRKISTENGQN